MLQFEGHQSGFINVKNSALLSDIIKRLSLQPVCLSTSLSLSFLLREIKETPPLWLCAFVLVSLAHCLWFIPSLRRPLKVMDQSVTFKGKQEINTSPALLVHFT